MREILVIRFGSLGDLCLLGWSLSALADTADPPRVTLVTKAALAPLATRLRGVHRVEALAGPGLGELRDLARRLRSRRWDAIVDAHGVLRSHLLLGLLGRRPQTRLAKDTVARLAFLRWRRAHPALRRTMRQRFDALFLELAGRDPQAAVPAPLGGLPRAADPGPPRLGLAPGAQWASKRWPAERFAAVATAWRRRPGAPVSVFLGPREEAWFPGSALAALAAGDPGLELVRGQDLPAVAARLAGCGALVTNDSGLLHLAEAAGVPVVACFGPTVREFGYFPLLPRSRVLEIALDCRPCSRNGKRPCHRGDLACLERIGAEAALEALRDLGLGSEPPAAGGD